MGAPKSSDSTMNSTQSPPTRAPSPSPRTGLKKFFRRSNSSSRGRSAQASEQGASSVERSTSLEGIIDLREANIATFPETPKSLAASRSQRAGSKKGKRTLLGGLLSKTGSGNQNAGGSLLSPDPKGRSGSSGESADSGDRGKTRSNPQSPKVFCEGAGSPTGSKDDFDSRSPSNQPQGRVTPKQSLFQWQDALEEEEKSARIRQKQLVKERDGFCRRVDIYDGQVIHVEGKACYELGNYLGGGVAGVVYEGHRLLPPDEYPVRMGINDDKTAALVQAAETRPMDAITVHSFLCMPNSANDAVLETKDIAMGVRDSSLLTVDPTDPADKKGSTNATNMQWEHTEEMALEATESHDHMVILDTIDAPSRSKHFAKAMTQSYAGDNDAACDSSFAAGYMDETVAIKILNPVGFRTLATEVTQTAVVAREGVSMDREVATGTRPMEERHVWWLINPSSRNLRTLQRYPPHGKGPRTVEVDRGSPEKGLRISLVAAYKDPRTGQLRELPLTRCIEIWGHVPFAASDTEFKEIMEAIDRVNQGLPPPPVPAFLKQEEGEDSAPGRVGTGSTSMSSALSFEDLRISGHPMNSKRTGIYRAAYSDRKTVYCPELSAYIAIPAAPSKYLKWLKQRRAATKEIRNMMLIGRHRNVVHLFEVLEHIQETKSTMFLILELVRGGELFDLISSNAAKVFNTEKIPPGFTESETIMRKFFRELASGVHYCHSNGIAHRDLKPENLLVHNSKEGVCTLKIADFGLSAAFGPNSKLSDQDTVAESAVMMSPPSDAPQLKVDQRGQVMVSMEQPPRFSPIKAQMDKLLSVGNNALAFLTCGAVDDIIICNPRLGEVEGAPSPLKRMTSVVGSPHYVAPEIVSQTESRRKSDSDSFDSKPRGYDGTKADVWSAGVILYAMLFRSLPFGEDLLRCPRYQSFKKWYDEVKRAGGRRSHLMAPINEPLTDMDERDFLGPHWFFPSPSSPESRDLIVYMLNPDPDQRPTIELVLRHPWLFKRAD